MTTKATIKSWPDAMRLIVQRQADLGLSTWEIERRISKQASGRMYRYMNGEVVPSIDAFMRIMDELGLKVTIETK